MSFVLSPHINQVSNKVPRLNLKVNGIHVNALIDTGSTLNIVPESITEKMHPKPRLQKSRTKVYASLPGILVLQNCHSGYRYSILDRLRLIPFDRRSVSVVLPV